MMYDGYWGGVPATCLDVIVLPASGETHTEAIRVAVGTVPQSVFYVERKWKDSLLVRSGWADSPQTLAVVLVWE